MAQGAEEAPAATPPALDRSDTWLVCEQTAAALRRLEGVLTEAVVAEDPLLRVVALELIQRDGKRMRPALLLLAAACGEFREPVLLRAAAAVEIVHVASLYHDDVLDRAPQRRGGASVNARWGNRMAGLGGSYLFAASCRLLGSLGEACDRMAGQAFVDLCAGQLQEVENAFNLQLTEADHLNILARKTGALIVLSCSLGAELARVPPPIAAALADYGRHLGLAFQLADDALDLVGSPEQMGKLAGTDLRGGVFSFPILRALGRGDAAAARLSKLLRQIELVESDVREIVTIVQETGSVGEAQTMAQEFGARACGALAALPAGAARTSLERLAAYAVARSR